MLSESEVSHFLDPDQGLDLGTLTLSVSLTCSVPHAQNRRKLPGDSLSAASMTAEFRTQSCGKWKRFTSSREGLLPFNILYVAGRR